MSGNEVKKILKKWGFPLKNVAELMGESPQNLNSMLNAQDIKTGVVAKIAHAIKKPLYLFFQDNDDLKTCTQIAAEDKEMCLDKVPVYKCDPKDAIIAAKDEVIVAKQMIIERDAELIASLRSKIKELEAQLYDHSAGLHSAPAADTPSVGGCQTSAK